jgi:hypothetical protein|eukprot:COSAG06_NODE_200_length_20386_cov_35.829547_13_plen_208_part_00
MQVVNGVIHRTVNGVLLNQFQIPSPGVSPMQNSESTDAVRPSKALPLPQQHSQSLPANLSCVSRKCRKECVSCAANSLVFLSLCCCCFVTTAQQKLSFLEGSDEDSLSESEDEDDGLLSGINDFDEMDDAGDSGEEDYLGGFNQQQSMSSARDSTGSLSADSAAVVRSLHAKIKTAGKTVRNSAGILLQPSPCYCAACTVSMLQNLT